MPGLNAKEARIFRITHIDNVPWILRHGLHCRNSAVQDPGFIQIGLPELIQKRAARAVPIKPGGSLSDFIPFYFTPSSIMMYKIKTGHGVTARPNEEIVIMVSSIHRLVELNLPFVFTDAHAYMFEASYFDDVRQLSEIDWALLQSKDFRNDPEDPRKQARYQAEALVHKRVPIEALLGIGCYNEAARSKLQAEANGLDSPISVQVVPRWYF